MKKLVVLGTVVALGAGYLAVRSEAGKSLATRARRAVPTVKVRRTDRRRARSTR
jgi:hypothetical protein